MARRLFVLACATVIEEMIPLMPEGAEYEILDFGLHVNPEQLRQTLQRRIDALEAPYDAVILGYGLCSQAVIGLQARQSPLVIPRVDDCIAIFLGSREAHREQHAREPGTYYLTKGWIEVGDTPFAEYERMLRQYGRERADRLIRLMLANYTRLALINTGQYELEKYREYARRTAERFGLRYEEIPGSTALIRKMLYGPWTPEEFVVVPPGGTVRYEDFFYTGPGVERQEQPKDKEAVNADHRREDQRDPEEGRAGRSGTGRGADPGPGPTAGGGRGRLH